MNLRNLRNITLNSTPMVSTNVPKNLSSANLQHNADLPALDGPTKAMFACQSKAI